jgi:hypothetical protein
VTQVALLLKYNQHSVTFLGWQRCVLLPSRCFPNLRRIGRSVSCLWSRGRSESCANVLKRSIAYVLSHPAGLAWNLGVAFPPLKLKRWAVFMACWGKIYDAGGAKGMKLVYVQAFTRKSAGRT